MVVPYEFRTIVLDARRRFLLCFFISFPSFYIYDDNALPLSSLVLFAVMVFSPSLMIRQLIFSKAFVCVLLWKPLSHLILLSLFLSLSIHAWT